MSAGSRAPGAAPPARPRLVTRCRDLGGPRVAAVRVWLRGGARAAELPGQALLTGRLLAEGTRRRGWREIAEAAEERGMGLVGFGGAESIGVAIDCLAGDLDVALEWAAELTLEPAFPEERFAWAVRQTAAELASLGDEPEVVAGWAFLRQLYGRHPRGLPLQGTPDSLARLTVDGCAALHRESLARGVVVTVAGALDEEGVARRVEALFADVGGDAAPDPTPPAPVPSRRRRQVEPTPGRDQAHLLLGHLTVPRDHADLAALEIAGVALGAGGGLGGRIPARIRERDGLAYAVSAATTAGAGLDPGRLVVHVGTAPERAAAAERAVRDELERFVADGLEERELESARSYLVGREPFRRETARQWADLLAEAELYGLPVDDPDWRPRRWAGLARADVEAAVGRHLEPAALRVTLGLPR